MISRFIKWFVGDTSSITPAQLDGFLLTTAAIFLFQQGMLSGEDSYKYFNSYFLYFAKFGVGSLAAGAMALKTFRANPGKPDVGNPKPDV
jgi:hypothetical protein